MTRKALCNDGEQEVKTYTIPRGNLQFGLDF